MAISLYSSNTNISTGFNVGPQTFAWSVASGGGFRLLVLFADIWQDVGGTGTVTAATYNGVGLTKVTQITSTAMSSEIWYLVNPDPGINLLRVTVTGATDAIKLGGASFTGVKQTGTLDTSNTAIGASGDPTISVTTGVANALVVATLSRFSTTAATTNRTSIYNDAVTSTLAAGSYQIATTTGSYSDTYTGTSANDWSMIVASFAPDTSSAPVTSITATGAWLKA